MSAQFDPNPSLYRRLLEPKADLNAVDDAVNKFFDGIKKLREECGIPDVVLAIEVPYINDSGNEVAAFAHYHFGHLLNKLPMLARAYGAVLADFETLVGDAVAGGRASGR